MKKIKYLNILLTAIFAFYITDVFAASGNLGVSSPNVYVGDSFQVTVNVNGAAAWNVHVSASGPVTGCVINQADATADAMDTNKTFSATCTAAGTGTITINLSGDVTSASDGNAVNISSSRTVNVTSKPVTPNPTPNPKPNTPTDNRSKNNNIKELSVDGYDLTKIDSNNYTLSVSNDVTSINILATAEDSKSQVTGTGFHDINVGENNIEVIVTAENGLQNKIVIKVTRKDGYYLEDLDNVLKNNQIDNINIIINYDTNITTQDLEKIKNSNKTVKLNYYNSDKALVYSWIINGAELDNTNELLTTISNDTDNKKDILRLSNYADGLFIGLNQTSNLPSGVKIRIYVGAKYIDNDLVNVYVYKKNDDKLELVKNKIKVENGFVEFDVTEASDYFVTMSTIPESDKVVVPTNKSNNSIFIIIIVLLPLLVISLIIVLIVKNKKDKNEEHNKENSIDTIPKENEASPTNTIDTISYNQSVNNTYDNYNNQNNTTNDN